MFNIDIQSLVVAVTVITGLTNGIQLGFEKYSTTPIKGFISFVIAMILGLVFGLLHWFGLSGPEVGLVAALVSSGLYKFTTNIGGK